MASVGEEGELVFLLCLLKQRLTVGVCYHDSHCRFMEDGSHTISSASVKAARRARLPRRLWCSHSVEPRIGLDALRPIGVGGG